MRRTTIGSRWNIPRQRYAGGWRQNPWINAVYNALHGHSDSSQDRQQTAAVRTWENEGGSLGSHPTLGR